MKKIDLKGTLRNDLGKKASKKIRTNEQVPCILYGNGTESLHFTVSERDLQPVLYTPHAYLVKLDLDGKKAMGVMREIQFHPVTDKPLHIDFINVTEDKPVIVELPIAVSGNSEGVKQGGKLQVVNRKLKVSALLKDMPETLPVDITNLGLGKGIYVKELSYPNLTLLTSPIVTVCRIKTTRASREQQNAATPGKK